MVDNNISREPMLEMFIFETNQMIENLSEIIMKCEKNKNLENSDINEIFRIMHTIKGSASMMMFNSISTLAHSLEDLFFYIREHKDTKIEFVELSDLVLASTDYIKGQIEKIENGVSEEDLNNPLTDKIKNHLAGMKGTAKVIEKEAPVDKKEENTKFYISTYGSSKTKKSKFSAHVRFDDDCQMENIRAYMIVHDMKEVCEEIYHIPEDIIDNNETAAMIKENGFDLFFSSNLSYQEVETMLRSSAFLKSLVLEEIEEFSEVIEDEKKKKTINLDDTNETMGTIYKAEQPEKEADAVLANLANKI